ncbi:MAG: CBS domain-containing protein, partial [Chloroflexi bacterium]
VGLLTRRAVDRAMSHDLGGLPVSRVMRAGRVTVRPSDSVERVQQLMLAEGWGQIPVVADSDDGQAGDRPIGVVTRTDVLNYLFQALPETAVPEMRRLLVHSLPPALWQMVVVVGETADSLGMPLYFVGGIVRDLLLGHSPTDLDMVVEGDAIALVQKLQARFGGQIHTHSRFGTAKWFVTPAIWQRIAPTASLENVPATIDFVTARTEFYREPSALPEVSRGSIKLDLHRRDFTINTLAIRLDGVHLGEFLDFYGGRRDLEQGVIRVLHSLSFVDDPTRILRAVRLEQRLGFRIEPRTMELLVSSLPMLDRVTGDRIRHEIELALRESNPVPVMERLWELGVMRQIHPALAWSQETAVAFARVPKLLTDPEWKAALRGESPAFVYFALWILPLTAEEQTAVMDRLRVRKATREDMAAIRRVYAGLCALPPTARRSEVAALLRPYPARVLLAVRAAFGEDKPSDWIEAYYREWQWVKTAVTGDDLRAMGLKPGPLYGRLLNHLLAARLDGEVQTEAEEKELLNKLLAEIDQTNK